MPSAWGGEGGVDSFLGEVFFLFLKMGFLLYFLAMIMLLVVPTGIRPGYNLVISGEEEDKEFSVFSHPVTLLLKRESSAGFDP